MALPTISPPTFGLVPLATGLNLIGLPVRPDGTMSASGLAYDVATQGGEVAQVIKWAKGSQSYILWSASSPEANDFPIEEGSGYFVRALTPPPTGEWAVSGQPFTAPVVLDLVVGLDLISVPLASGGSNDSASLADAIASQGGNAAQVIRWSSTLQSFELWSASASAANVFDIGPAEGYFALVTTAAQVSP